MKPLFKLFNSGTSEGVKKGWESRHGDAHDEAESSSFVAERKSAYAHGVHSVVHDKDSARKSVDANMEASKAHGEAADNWGDLKHEDATSKMEYHGNKETSHKARAEELKKKYQL